MSKASLALKGLPLPCQTILARLGADIAVARKRRRISLRDMAARMSVSLSTLQRLERGEPAVSLGVLLSALWVLQLHDRVDGLLDPGGDRVGLLLELERLPKRLRRAPDDDLDF